MQIGKAAAWGRTWRSSISSTAHGGNTGDKGCSLPQPSGSDGTVASGNTTAYSTTTGSRSTTGTITSGSFATLQMQLQASVVEGNADHEVGEEERMKKVEYTKALVVRFPSDMSTPERWLSELEVTWVLLLANLGESERNLFISRQLLYLARSWIQALFEITEHIYIYLGERCISKEDGPPASEFVRFFEATLSKMLPFVEAIVAVRASVVGTNNRWGSVEPADEKLQALILVRDALSTTSVQILSSCVDLADDRETRDLLLAQLPVAKLDEAIWDTMEETMAGFMSSASWGTPRSSDVHPITRSLLDYIRVLQVNNGLVNRVLHYAFLRGEYVCVNQNDGSHLTNLTKEMLHSLEQKLTKNMQSVPWNKSLKFLFLINNLYFMHQQTQLWPLAFPMSELASKIDYYINSYIHVSWAPVLKCLHNPTPHCFKRNSPLPKFESCFRITYEAQKFWKVPDPGMRTRMREAIIEELIPGFTEFLKDNTLCTLRISPQVMKVMLQELFEG